MGVNTQFILIKCKYGKETNMKTVWLLYVLTVWSDGSSFETQGREYTTHKMCDQVGQATITRLSVMEDSRSTFQCVETKIH